MNGGISCPTLKTTVLKHRIKRSVGPTHLHSREKTFWIKHKLNDYLKEITDKIGISQNYLINNFLSRLKSGDIDAYDPIFRDSIDLQT